MRQFIYSEDLARSILGVLFDVKDISQMPNGLIVAPNGEVSIREIVEIIAEKFNLPGNRIEFDTSYSDGQHRKTACNHLLLKLFDPDFLDLYEGIERSIDWFVANYKNARK